MQTDKMDEFYGLSPYDEIPRQPLQHQEGINIELANIQTIQTVASKKDVIGLLRQRFKGCCHPTGENKKNGFRLTKKELMKEAQRMVGIIIYDSHDTRKPVGKVLTAYVDEEEKLMISGGFFDNEFGREAHNNLVSKKYSGLSLGCRHLFDQNTQSVIESSVEEVSVCEKGQLPQTEIFTYASRQSPAVDGASHSAEMMTNNQEILCEKGTTPFEGENTPIDNKHVSACFEKTPKTRIWTKHSLSSHMDSNSTEGVANSSEKASHDGEGKVSSLEEAPSQTPPPSTNLFATTSTKDDLKDYTKELRELPGLFAKALHENGEAFKATQKLHSTSHEEKKDAMDVDEKKENRSFASKGDEADSKKAIGKRATEHQQQQQQQSSFQEDQAIHIHPEEYKAIMEERSKANELEKNMQQLAELAGIKGTGGTEALSSWIKEKVNQENKAFSQEMANALERGRLVGSKLPKEHPLSDSYGRILETLDHFHRHPEKATNEDRKRARELTQVITVASESAPSFQEGRTSTTKPMTHHSGNASAVYENKRLYETNAPPDLRMRIDEAERMLLGKRARPPQHEETRLLEQQARFADQERRAYGSGGINARGFGDFHERGGSFPYGLEERNESKHDESNHSAKRICVEPILPVFKCFSNVPSNDPRARTFELNGLNYIKTVASAGANVIHNDSALGTSYTVIPKTFTTVSQTYNPNLRKHTFHPVDYTEVDVTSPTFLRMAQMLKTTPVQFGITTAYNLSEITK